MEEKLQLNEDTVWYGGPRDRNNEDALPHLPQLRELLMQGRLKEAEELAALTLPGLPETQRHYLPLGDLLLTIGGHDQEAEDYRRELDLSDGVARVSYRIGDVSCTRELFASHPDQTIVLRFTADTPGAISLKARFSRKQWKYMEKTEKWGHNGLVMRGECGGEGGSQFRVVLKAVLEGGSCRTLGEHLLIEKADSVTLLLMAATTFRYSDPETHCKSQLSTLEKLSYNELLVRHTQDYKALYNRVELELPADIGGAMGELPTDERLGRIKEGKADNGLVALYFQYGRYLLISSSRPGSLPANLQGIWNDSFLPPWDSKYTININTQMNYWLAENGNLAECHEPLFELIERMREPGRRTARVCMTAGALQPIIIQTSGRIPPRRILICRLPLSGRWAQHGSALHLWEHYRFGKGPCFFLGTGLWDHERRRQEFLLDYLIEDNREGRLVTCPSVSPENSYIPFLGERAGVLCVRCLLWIFKSSRALFGVLHKQAVKILYNRGF